MSRRQTPLVINRILAISKKEFKQFFRDKLILFAFLFLPVSLTIILGYALNFDLYGIKVGVLDKDKTPESRRLLETFSHSEYFRFAASLNTEIQADKYLNENRLRCVVVIPEDFSGKLNSNQDVSVQLLIDGSEGSIATAVANYVRSAVLAFAKDIEAERSYKYGIRSLPGIGVSTLFLYNSGLKSSKFFVPGLIAIILTIVSVVSIAMSVANEKETGTISLLRISQTSFVEIVSGKILTYAAVILFVFIIILIASYIFFGIYVKGSYTLLSVSTLLFLFAGLNLGLFVSAVTNTRQLAFQVATFLSLTPSIILSGFIFPIENMPRVIQILSNITPSKFFIVILRSVIIKGAGLSAIWPEMLSLFAFGFVFFFLSVLLNVKGEAQ
ncbi:MAG: ABC transporter permease [Syntrophomonadaceae bacterium]